MLNSRYYEKFKEFFTVEDLCSLTELNLGSFNRFYKKGILISQHSKNRVFSFNELVKARIIFLLQKSTITSQNIAKILSDLSDVEEYQIIISDPQGKLYVAFGFDDELEHFKLLRENGEIAQANDITVDYPIEQEIYTAKGISFKNKSPFKVKFDECYVILVDNIRKSLKNLILDSEIDNKDAKIEKIAS